ncbi:hypothetical protein [uncultured Flavobacterium sp.]|uniref:hypothetical protein n=1 Tax=uncultured Flavobacterium sp. TaxID=165435 RepID=UPI0025F9645A|nr:hypothetical protein [uncultured Flavobacterium sp.]
METVKEFFKSIFDSYSDRVNNPFIGSLVISYVIYNWEMFAILIFAEWPIHCKIEWIQSRYYKMENFVIPIIVALFYILILPYLNIIFDVILSTSTKITQKKKDLLHTNKLLIQERDAHQKRKIADAEAGTSATKDLNDRINNLKDEILALNERNKQDIERHKESEKRSKEIENDLSNALKQSQISREEMLKQFSNEKDLLKNNLIPKSYAIIIQNLTENDKNSFINFMERFNKKDTNAVDSIRNQIEKLISYNLIISDHEGNIHVTDKGKQVFHYLIM